VQLKRMLLKRRAARGGGSGGAGAGAGVLTAAEAFLLGAIARGVATVAVFPYTRAKVPRGRRRSARLGGSQQPCDSR